MKKSGRIRPGKKCKECAGYGCSVCSNRGFIVKQPKPKKRINPVKSKRVAANFEYAHLRKSFLIEHPKCTVLGPTGPCGAAANQIHHRKGRGKFYLDVTTWIGTCETCHENIHQKHQPWARRMFYLVNPIAIAPCPPVSPIFLPYDHSE